MESFLQLFFQVLHDTRTTIIVKYVDTHPRVYILRNSNPDMNILKWRQYLLCDLLNLFHYRIHVYPEGKHSNQIKYAEDFNMRVQDFLMADEELSGTNLRDDEEDIKLAKANFF